MLLRELWVGGSINGVVGSTLFSPLERFPVLPASGFHFAMFLISVINSCCSSHFGPSPVIEVTQAARYVHEHAGVPSPSVSPLVKSLVSSARRSLAKPTRISRGLDVDILLRLADRFYQCPDIGWFSIFVSLVVSFAGFWRWDDLNMVDLSLVLFRPDCVLVFLRSSKTDQFCKGHWAVIAAVGGRLCPVHLLERWIAWSGITSGPLSRTVNRSKGIATLTSKPLPYGRYLELIRQALRMSGMSAQETREFGTRCTRIGGASVAAEMGIEDRLFKKHGRWVSERIKDGYVRESIQQRLVVTRSLGLGGH